MPAERFVLSNEAAREWAKALIQGATTEMEWVIAMALQEAHSKGFSLAVDEMERRLVQPNEVRD